jgi:hypothetical protein
MERRDPRTLVDPGEGRVDPVAEEEFWREAYASRPYVPCGAPFLAYAPAYRFGWEASFQYGSSDFEEVEPELARRWGADRERHGMSWDRAREAAHDAWLRVRRLAS